MLQTIVFKGPCINGMLLLLLALLLAATNGCMARLYYETYVSSINMLCVDFPTNAGRGHFYDMTACTANPIQPARKLFNMQPRGAAGALFTEPFLYFSLIHQHLT